MNAECRKNLTQRRKDAKAQREAFIEGNESRQAKPRGRGSRKAETSQQNSVGELQSHPGKIGHPPEANFASSPVMAARSVNSQC